jgi:hypothetical protein
VKGTNAEVRQLWQFFRDRRPELYAGLDAFLREHGDEEQQAQLGDVSEHSRRAVGIPAPSG